MKIKQLLPLFCIFTLFSTSCSVYSPTSSTIENSTQSLSARSIDASRLLSLQDGESYRLMDYDGQRALLLIFDPENRVENNPYEVRLTDCERFAVLDLTSGAVEQEYPVQTFGICSGALLAYGGILFPLITVNDDGTITAAIYFQDGPSRTAVYRGGFTWFGDGPVLRRCGQDVLFSYSDDDAGTFGVNKITQDGSVTPLLCLRESEAEYLSDNFSASDTGFAYAVGKSDRLTFYYGTADGTALQEFSLPQGEKIYGFSLAGNALLVSLAPAAEDNGRLRGVLAQFDPTTGQQINCTALDGPLYNLSVNQNGQISGFIFSVFHVFSLPLKSSSISKQSSVSGDFYRIYPGTTDFLVQIYGYSISERPTLWQVMTST